MYKILTTIVAFVATFGLLAVADVTQTSSAIDVLINDADFKDTTIESVNELVVDVAAIISQTTVQIDTNATTTTTQYTPAAAGALLVGSEGGSNRLWISSGATTNDWDYKVSAD